MATLARALPGPSLAAPGFVPPLVSTLVSADLAETDLIEQYLRTRIGPERYEMWFDGKTDLALADATLTVRAANAFAANWIRGKFLEDLQAAAHEATGRSLRVDVVVADLVIRPAHQSTTEPAGPIACVVPAAPATRPAVQVAPPPLLNPKYTLEEFVVGSCNQMAYHAAMKVAEVPGQQFNPLFIHGHCGLGKTHLLHGICHRFAKLYPGKKWLYLTGEQFTNDFLEAIRTHKTDAFRKRLRTAELLVIDDVHFLANKKATQEEFLHTFNQIDAGGRQVVLASDCAPRQIASMAESLTSRFVSGMVLRIDAPDQATRIEILRRKIARNRWQVSDAVLTHIASSAAASVRELEGLLLQVVAGMSLVEHGADPAAVVAGLRERTDIGRGPVPTDRIVAAVAEYFGVSTAQVLGAARDKAVSLARAVAMYLARQHTGMSFPELGRALGGRNHSTVIAACQRVEALLATGELVRWSTPTEARHQTMPEVIRELQAKIRH